MLGGGEIRGEVTYGQSPPPYSIKFLFLPPSSRDSSASRVLFIGLCPIQKPTSIFPKFLIFTPFDQ